MRKCGVIASHKYTWAGRDEAFCCFSHATQIKSVADAIGYYIQLIPVEPKDDVTCSNVETLQ